MPELLSPAGDFEKLKSAIRYGADAVYLAGHHFGMRAASSNFSGTELSEAVIYAHERGVKVYVAVNILPRTREYNELSQYIKYLSKIGADAVIVSDIGVLSLVKRVAPELEIHISTQASAVSAEACLAWHEAGAKRIVLARELTLEEIREIRALLPDTVELECFVHGSMCIAYSGRCLLSQYFVGRDANRGACAQPCRWIYNTVEIAEVKRPGQNLPVVEEGGETFIMSSKDMCMIEHIPELCESGITSFKIEGRVRSAYFAAVVTNTYRMAIDAYLKNPDDYKTDPKWLRELDSVSHREYGTGFFFNSPSEDANTVTSPGYIREKAYLAVAVQDSDGSGYALFRQRNKMVRGSSAELLTPGKPGIPFSADEIMLEDGTLIDSTPHPEMLFYLKVPYTVKAGDIIREGDNIVC